MAVRKKTRRSAPRTKTADKKRKAAKPAFGGDLRKTSKKFVDKILVQMSPQLQEKIQHLIKTLEASGTGPVRDLNLLAGKILVRAQEVSRQLRTMNKRGKRRG